MNFWNRITAAKRFAPHQFSPVVSFLGDQPQILIAKEAYDTMYYIVEAAPEEFGWLGLVERKGMTFLIKEVFIFEQEVSGVTVDIEDTPDSNPIGKFFLDLIREGGAEKANKIRAWMHSHVNMGVTPSGHYGPGSRGDLCQMYQFGQNGNEYFIMGIVNKLGEMRFEIFFYDLGIRVIDVPWEIYEPEQEELRKKVAAEVRAKTKTPPPPVSTWHGRFGPDHTTAPTHHTNRTKKGKGGRYGR